MSAHAPSNGPSVAAKRSAPRRLRRWVLPIKQPEPINPALLELAGQHQLVISIEDNDVVGGCGSRLAQELRFAGVDTPVREFGIAPEFLEHGTRAELLEQLGPRPQDITRYAVEAIVRKGATHGQGADSARL